MLLRDACKCVSLCLIRMWLRGILRFPFPVRVYIKYGIKKQEAAAILGCRFL